MSKKPELIHDVKFWKPQMKEDILFFSGHFNRFEFDKHVHEEYTITLVHDNNMKAFLNGFSNIYAKSSILTINPDEVHACMTQENEGYKYNSIYFKESFLKKVFGKNANNMYFSKNLLTNKNLYKNLTKLVRLDESSAVSKLDLECKFISYLSKIMNINTKVNTNINTSKNMPNFLNEAKDFISDNYSKDLCLDDFAYEFNVSKYHFLRLFKEHNFVSPHNYLMIKRVERAKEFLKKGDSLVQTALNCGFHDQSHLHKKFKALTGLTPKQFQNFFN